MRGAEGQRGWRPRIGGLIAGVAIAAFCLGPSVVDAIAASRDDRTVTNLRHGCRLLIETSVQRWLPGARAERERAERDALQCRWRAADPTLHNPTVRLKVTVVQGTDETSADQAARQVLYGQSDGPSLALAGLQGDSDGSVRWVRVPEIGDEAVTTMKRQPRERPEEVTVTVHARRSNAIVQVSFHAYGVPEATAVEAAQTLAREAVNRL